MVETYWCERCELYVEKEELVRLDGLEGRIEVPCCPRCRSHVRRESQERARGVVALAVDAVEWPGSRRAMVAVVGLGLTSFLLFRFAGLFLIGPAISAATMLTYAAAIVRSTAAGEDEPPYGVDLDGWLEVFATLLRYQFLVALAAAPATAFAITMGVSAGTLPMLSVLVVGGLLYLPAALIVAAHANGFFSAIWPLSPLRVAVRFGVVYLRIGAATVVLGLGALLAFALALVLMALASPIPLVPGFLAACVAAYGLLVNARFLGLVVREHRQDVGL